MDCIISGLSLYTQNLLLILAYSTAEDEDEDEDEDEGAGATTPKLARGHRQRPSTASAGSEPSGGIRRRQNRLPPELRLIDLSSQAEVEKDALGVSRFERLGSNDYHLGVLPAHNAASAAAVSKGALEALAGFGSEVWNATLGGINAVTVNPTKSLFSSGASVLSRHSDDAASGSVRTPTMSTATGASGRLGKGTDVTSMAIRAATRSVHPNLTKPGAKIFVHSPYDCILAVRRDRTDHLAWLLEHHKYEAAWHLVDEHSDVVGASTRRVLDAIPQPATPVRETREFSVPGIAALSPATPALSTREQQDDGFYSDAASVSSTTTGHQGPSSTQAAESEKRRIGELWVAQLVASGDWPAAGETLARVLGNAHADGWRRWAWAFASAGRFDELAAHLPTVRLHPVPIPTTLYEVVLGHYMQAGNRPRLRYLVQERWPPESGLYDVDTVSSALENQLKFRDVREDSVEDGERGRDWRIVLECLARLHEAAGRRRDALRCHIRLQDADAAMRLVRDHHLADAVVDDVPGFVSLRVPRDRADDMSVPELEEATAEAIAVLVESAQLGLVQPRHVIEQLQRKGFMLYVFFYLRALWTGDTGAAAGAAGTDDDGHGHARTQETRDRLALESKDLVGATDYADLAVRLFAEYDRSLLMDFLRRSTAYSFEKVRVISMLHATTTCERSEDRGSRGGAPRKTRVDSPCFGFVLVRVLTHIQAAQECEAHGYVPELVYLYSKTGQAKKALYLIIDRLGDVSQAIAFAKEQDDAYLWDDLLAYSMDKPRFIRALLEEVGTAIDPITLVRRIPEGLEIDGLRQGLRHMMKEHEIQLSISQGVARALRSEVAAAQATLRAGRSKGIKFEVVHEDDKQRQQHEVSVQASDVPTNVAAAATPVVGVSDSLGGQLDGTGDAKGKGKAIAAAPDEDDNDGEILPLEGLLSGTPSKNKGKTKKASSAKGEQPGHSHRLPMPGHCAVCHRAFAAVQDDDDYTSSRADTLVGFACGHVFHLRHLLRMLDALEKGEAEVSDDEDDGDRTPGVGGAYEGTVGHYEGTSNWRRVGSKVTHARLLRDRVAAGCPVCRKLKGETAAVNP